MDTIHKMDVSPMIISACKKFRSNYSNVEDRVFKFLCITASKFQRLWFDVTNAASVPQPQISRS